MPIDSTLAAVAILLAIVADIVWHAVSRIDRSDAARSGSRSRSSARAAGSASHSKPWLINRRVSGRIATIVTATVLALLAPAAAAPPVDWSPQLAINTFVHSGDAVPTATIGGTFAPTATSEATGIPSPTPAVAPTDPASPGASPPPTPLGTPAATPVPSSATASIDHVFVIVMENHSSAQVWNTANSPYITSLGNAGARASNYFAITHPSLPNYLDLYGGSNYGITTDCSPSSNCHVNARNLADNLEAAGLSWKGYFESMPSTCGTANSGQYAVRHDPFVYFDDIRLNAARCAAHVVQYTRLAGDLASNATTPNFVWISPNVCNDMHSCSVATGDTWLKNNVPPILSSPACTVDRCLLIVTWDEDNGSLGNRVLTLFDGPAARVGVVSTTRHDHFGLLRTVEWIFGLPTQTSGDATAAPMTELLR
jgi:hypothetical protein